MTADGTALVTGRVVGAGGGSHGGPGIPGVAVSDGLTVTQTDADGGYRLTVDVRRRITALVHITVPAGWRAPSGGSGTPAFFRTVDAAEGDEARVDFVLHPDRAADRDEYRFVALADVHVEAGTVNTRESFGAQLRTINALAREIEHGTGPPGFVAVAGDLTNNATAGEFQDYLRATAESSVPVWPAVGNHDLVGRQPGGAHQQSTTGTRYREAIERYRRAVGPEWYSFQYGPHHFVVLENYLGLTERDQFRWLEQDLALGAGGRQVVVISHVPWNVPQTPGPDTTSEYLRLLARYDVRLLLAGHTHANDVVTDVLGDAVHAVTTSAVGTLDQAPRGFRIVEFRDGRVSLPYAELDAHRRPTVVFPVGIVDVARQPAGVWVSRYHPPGVAAEAEYRVPPQPWRPLRPVGTHTWTGDLDAGGLEPGRSHHLHVRVRDRPTAAWTECGEVFVPVADTSVTPPCEGSPWPMFHRDARHTGLSPDVVAPPLGLAWVQHSGGTILSSSAAVADGTVFIGVRDEDRPDGNGVIALDFATGTCRWWTAAPGAVEGSVAVARDIAGDMAGDTAGNIVLAPSVRGPLRALEAGTGAVRWEWMPQHHGSVHGWMYFSPTIADQVDYQVDYQVVYQAYSVASGTFVAALDAGSGRLRWHTAGPVGRNWISHASPAVDGNLLVFATAYANLVALDTTTGAVRWQTTLGGGLGVFAKPVISDGLVLQACQGDRLVAVEAASGTVRWRYEAAGEPLLPGGGTAATPAVAGGTAYTGFSDGSVTAVRLADGTPLWRYQTRGAVLSSPAISGGVLYVGSNDGMVRALDRGSGNCVWAYDLGAWVASSPAVTGNAVVVGAWDGSVYAFTSGSAEPT